MVELRILAWLNSAFLRRPLVFIILATLIVSPSCLYSWQLVCYLRRDWYPAEPLPYSRLCVRLNIKSKGVCEQHGACAFPGCNFESSKCCPGLDRKATTCTDLPCNEPTRFPRDLCSRQQPMKGASLITICINSSIERHLERLLDLDRGTHCLVCRVSCFSHVVVYIQYSAIVFTWRASVHRYEVRVLCNHHQRILHLRVFLDFVDGRRIPESSTRDDPAALV